MTLIAHSVQEAARRIEADLFRLRFATARLVMVPDLLQARCWRWMGMIW